MALPNTEIIPQTTELSTEAFDAFCSDISGMFGVDMASSPLSKPCQTIKELEKHYKKLCAIITVQATGILEGDLYLIFDKEALFTLAGTIVMLPEERINSVRKNGSVQDAEELHDAVGETGNLLVGSWDRVFREELEGHTHFLQTGTFIGNPWENTADDIGLSQDEGFLHLPNEISVGSFPAFNCGVVFPERIFGGTPDKPDEAISEQPSPEVAQEAEIKGQAEPESPQTEEPDSPPEIPASPETRESAVGEVSQTIEQMVRSLPQLSAEHGQTLLDVHAGKVMNNNILWGRPDDSVQHAMEQMQQADVTYMMIGDSGCPEGIVTWIDLAEAVSIYLRPMFSKWHRPADDATLQIKIKVLMTRPVRTIKTDTSLSVILEDMCRHHLRCLPVMNGEGKAIGIVTAFDIFKFLLRMSPDFSISEQAAPSTNLSE